MKAIYKNLALGIFLTVFAAAVAAPSFAQDVCKDVDANQALYKRYTDNYDKAIEQVKVAAAAAKEYIQKYEACKDDKGTALYAEQVNYLKTALPALEKSIGDTEKAAGEKVMYDRFNKAGESKNVPEILASGKEIVAKYPDSLDIYIVMSNAAFDEVVAKPTVTTYHNDVITNAKKAIELIEGGKTSERYGAFKDYQLVNKNNALAVLNYNIGSTLLLDPAKKKDATSYFYKTTQYEAKIKSNPFIYQAIGANYLDEFLKIDKDRKDKLAISEGKITPETLEMELMQKGYAERAIDAYARAYKFAKNDPKAKKEYVDSLSGRLKELYAFRNDGKALDNVDTYVTTVTSKSLTDPTAKVEPVKEEAPPTTPATTTTTTPDSNTTTKPATTPTPKPATTTPGTGPTTTPTPKPAATTPTKPVNSTTTPTTPETTTDGDAATKDKAKKPAPKKKGTR